MRTRQINQKLRAAIIMRYGRQTDFAYDMGVNDSVVSRVITGRVRPTMATKQYWAEKLGCSVSEIFPEQ